jgi:hypothetical protein
MGRVGCTFEYRLPLLALFAGDDHFSKSQHITTHPTAYKFKVQKGGLSFCSKLIVNGEIVMNPVYMTAKVLTKEIGDQSDLDAYRQGVRDWLYNFCYGNVTKKINLSVVASAMEHGVTTTESLKCLQFLRSYALDKSKLHRGHNPYINVEVVPKIVGRL